MSQNIANIQNIASFNKGAAPLPGSGSQTLFAGYDGSLPASQSYSRLSNAWNSETGLVAPHNLLLQSEALSVSPWVSIGLTITPNNALSPFGAMTATTIVSAGGANSVTQPVTITAGSNTTFLLWLQSTSGANQSIRIVADSTTVAALTVTPTWTQYTVSVPSVAGGAGRTYGILHASSAAFSINAWGAQLNQYAVTDYVPTTTAAVYMPRYQTGRQGQGILIEGASTNKCTAWSVPRADSLGAELLTTAQQQCDSGWTPSGGTVVVDGKIRFSASPDVSFADSGTVAASAQGKKYAVTYTIDSISGGGVWAGGGGEPIAGRMIRTTAGTYTDYVHQLSNTLKFYIVSSGASTTAVIDTISIKEAVDYVGTKAFYNVSFQNPIPSMTLSGDTAATLSITGGVGSAEQTAIDNAIALNPTDGSMVALQAAKANGYKVYELDNSAGAAAAYATFAGTVGNTNAHSLRVIAKAVTAHIETVYGLTGTAGIRFTNTSYGATTQQNVTPSAVTRAAFLGVGAGDTAYFLLPSLEESAYATSPILCKGVATTRAAGAVSGTSAGVIAATSSSINIWFKPTAVATGKTQTLWSSYTDASNWTSLYSNGVIFYIEKRKAGVSEYVTVPITAVGGSWYLCSIIFNADGTMGLMVNGTADGKTSGAFPTGLGAELISPYPLDLQAQTFVGSNATINSATQFTAGTTANSYVSKTLGTLYKAYQMMIDGTATTGTLVAMSDSSLGNTLSAKGVAGSFVNVGGTKGFKLSGHSAGAVVTAATMTFKEVHNNTTATVPVIAATYKVGAFADTATGTLQADGLIDNERYFGRTLTLSEHTTYWNRGR